MKQKITILILSVVLVALIAVSVVVYNSYSDEYPEITTATSQPEETREIVQTADFTVTDASGNKVKLSDFFGKPIVVNFWATWCSPCTTELPHFESAYKQYGEEITFLMVNVDDKSSSAYSFAEKNGYTFPIYHDTSYNASFAYNVSSIPQTLFINSDGELVHSQIGMMSETAILSNIEKIR